MWKNILRILLGALIFWVWLSFARTYYICEVKGLCDPPPPTIDSSFLEKLPKTLQVMAGENAILENYPQFYFDYSSTAAVFTQDHEKLLDRLTLLLKNQPKARLHIIGYYLQNEKMPEVERYANLGVARAMTLADKLLHEYKVSTDQLMTSGKMLKDTLLPQPIALELLGFMPDLEDLREKEEERFAAQFDTALLKVSYNAVLGYFDPHRADFTAVPAWEDYVDSLLVFLAATPNAKLVLMGHSDTQLNDNDAQKAGLTYAKAIEKYFAKKGIKNKIESKSKGKKEPLMRDVLPDNSSDKLAVMKNRRVEISIKIGN